ncbi:hypothetical protein IQ22_04330 [Pseudomonas duriflava]|uniref:Uncharacterized protein n=2 Tax=Pseudomonas duriflava TaxID=459528 RepID=A0A562PT60_9PSED|nr:hypothetical protein IQ22_04330 [Pseudomonas duriflava]
MIEAIEPAAFSRQVSEICRLALALDGSTVPESAQKARDLLTRLGEIGQDLDNLIDSVKAILAEPKSHRAQSRPAQSESLPEAYSNAPHLDGGPFSDGQREDR